MDTSSKETNLAVVKASMKHLDELHEAFKAGREVDEVDFHDFYDALSDDFVFITHTTVLPHDNDYSKPPWSVVGKEQDKETMINTWSKGESKVDVSEISQGSQRTWEVGAPLEYFSNDDGSRIIVLLKERYGGLDHWNWGAMLFDVRDGKITRYEHIADMSGYLVNTGYLKVT
jgi:hypothetical protein